MRRTNQKRKVHLSPETRKELEALCRKRTAPVRQVRRARVLLLSDEDHVDGRRPDWQIAEILGISQRQVVRIRQQFVEEGFQPTLQRKKRSTPGTSPKFDGEAEARLVNLCCSTPPKGYQRWTLQLLVDELTRLQIVHSVCRETVRSYLKKMNLSPGSRNGSASPTKTVPDSSLTWKKSSTSTVKNMTRSIR